MDNWNSIKLSPNVLEVFAFRLNELEIILKDSEKCYLFFNRFPFDELFNFTMTNPSTVRLCVQILDFFANYSELYCSKERVRCILEYILVNLGHITKDCHEAFLLFQLLAKILQRTSLLIDNFKSVIDEERILATMVKLSTFESTQSSKFLYYTPLLELLVASDFKDSLNNFICDLFEKFLEHQMVEQQLYVCRIILNSKEKLLCACFQNVWQWLTTRCPIMLTENADTNLLENIVDCLLIFLENWAATTQVDQQQSLVVRQLVEVLCLSLNAAINNVCNLMSEQRLNNGCKKLLQFMIIKFLNEEKLSSDERNEILSTMDQLPEEAETWPNYDFSIFFCICHICLENSKCIWKPLTILNAILSYFYKNQLKKTFVLKSIYYLYPKLINEVKTDRNIKTLGDDMLSYFGRVCSLPHLYHFNRFQLRWMLERADKGVKLVVLTQWLNALEENDLLENDLISAISSCNAQFLLLQLILSCSNQTTGSRAAMVLSKVMNKEVSAFITVILPFTVEKPMTFCNFLLAEPGHCLDCYDATLICTMMGAIIPTLINKDILKGVCLYSGKLLSHHKDNPDVLRGFCQNTNNIRYVIGIIDKVGEETGVEIIRLLRLILVIQHKNKVKLTPTVQADFKTFLMGTSEKIKRSQCLLYYAASYRNSLIVLDQNDVMDIYDKLLEYSLDPVFQSDAFRCIISLLKRVPWLSQIMSTTVYIEMVCLLNSSSNFKTDVFKLLETWFSLIRKEPFNGHCSIPETALRSFILRGDISDCQKQNYLTTVEDLLRRRYYRTKKNVF